MCVKDLHIALLLGFYREVLSDHDRAILEMYFFDDFSLGKVLEKSRIRNEWDCKIKSMEEAKQAFFTLSALQ